MGIQYENITEVYSKHIKGQIRNGKYFTDQLLKISQNKISFTSKELSNIIEDLKQLEELLVAHETIEILDKGKEKDIHEVDEDGEFFKDDVWDL